MAANLSDETFSGVYRGKEKHIADFDTVIKRGIAYGVEKYLFSAGNIKDAIESYELSLKGEGFFTTIGVHPCRAKECEEEEGSVKAYMEKVE